MAVPFRGAEARAIDGAQVVYGGVVGDTATHSPRSRRRASFVVLRTIRRRASGRIAATSPLAGAAGVGLRRPARSYRRHAGDGTLADADAAARAERTAALVALTMSITSAVAERLLGAPLEGLSVGATGGKVKGNLLFVDTARADAQRHRRSCEARIRALRGQYVAVGAHSDHVGYRATGAVDHDSLHLYLQQRFFAAENPSGSAARRRGAEGACRTASRRSA